MLHELLALLCGGREASATKRATLCPLQHWRCVWLLSTTAMDYTPLSNDSQSKKQSLPNTCFGWHGAAAPRRVGVKLQQTC